MRRCGDYDVAVLSVPHDAGTTYRTFGPLGMRQMCANRLKQWRGIATRYEQRACNYRTAVVIVALVLWLEG